MQSMFGKWYKLAAPDSFKVKESEKAALQRLKVTGGDLFEKID